MPQFLCTFEVNLEYTFARLKKYSSKLDISCSLIRTFELYLSTDKEQNSRKNGFDKN